MLNKKDLHLLCIAIGSLPHTNVDEAMKLVNKYFKEVPFWPQLFNLNKKEDMTIQFTENIPGIEFDKDCKPFINNNSEKFIKESMQLNKDFEEVIHKNNYDSLDKYALTLSYSSTFGKFIEMVKTTQPKYAKGQISGAFTQAVNIKTKDNQYACCVEPVNTVIKQALTLNAIWQINEIKKASECTIPIIFQDEPTLSLIPKEIINIVNITEVINTIKEISSYITIAGGINAIHCCGNTDWGQLLNTKPDIISFDAYEYSENFCKYNEEIKNYLKNGGIIAWGIIPTLIEDDLKKENLDTISEKFYNIINSISGVEKDLIYKNMLITPACGAGALSIESAEKAINLTKQLSELTKEKGIKFGSKISNNR